MSKAEILFYSIAIAFAVSQVFVKKVKVRYRVKPFSCMMCMGGWSAFALALIYGYGLQSLLFLPAGMFVGAMTEGLMNKYL
jgi:hypothetical protein